MVQIEEMEEAPPPAAAVSEERLLDAQAIEEAAEKMTRVSARMHLEALAKKLRKESEALKRVEKSQAKAAAAPPTKQEQPVMKPAAAVITPPESAKYVPVDRFSFDAGGYDSGFVTLYVTLPSVGSIPRDRITCTFTKSSFDLIVNDLEGKSYRLTKDNLAHDIEPEKSKHVVKADKVLVKLAKKKSEYGSYDFWNELVDKKRKKKDKSKENPADSIMDLMKDMYESGDDNMRKVIGETMEKQRRGELNQPGSMDNI